MTDIVERLRKSIKWHGLILDETANEIEALRQQVAAGQAREVKLRECLAWYVSEDDVVLSMPGNEYWVDGLKKAQEALTLPSDDTALKEAIKQAKRDALLEAAEWFDDGYEYSAANNTARELHHMAEEMK